jgi:hypothetical protein
MFMKIYVEREADSCLLAESGFQSQLHMLTRRNANVARLLGNKVGQ